MVFPRPVAAQEPVCPVGKPTLLYYTACIPMARFPAARFLSDFSIDHLLKPSPPPVVRTFIDFGSILTGNILAGNETLMTYLDSLPPVRFTQLDESTGVFVAGLEDSQRSFKSEALAGVDDNSSIEFRMPNQIEGGYWRAPDVLQMAFWLKKRIGITVKRDSGQPIEGEIECIALSTSQLRIKFADQAAPSILISFVDCQ